MHTSGAGQAGSCGKRAEHEVAVKSEIADAATAQAVACHGAQKTVGGTDRADYAGSAVAECGCADIGECTVVP